MKILIFQILLAYLKNYAICSIILEDQRYNFPLEANNSNTIYLNDYTQEIVQAPYYSIQSSNQFNLKIDQSISQLGNLNFNQSIRIGSNFIAQSGVYSNCFWALTEEQTLFKGLIKTNGEIQMTQLDFMISMDCFQISLIMNDFLMLSCFNNGDLCFSILNTTNFESTEFIVNYTLSSQYQNPNVQILSVNNTNFTFCLIYTTPLNAHIVYFTNNQIDIDLIEEKIFEGLFTRAILSENQNFLFMINSNYVYLADLTENTGVQIIINQHILNPKDHQPITEFQIFQINKNIFHIVVLQNKILNSFLFDSQFIEQNALIKQFQLNEYHQIIQFEVTLYNIYLITDTFIIKLLCKNSIKATSYHQLNFGNYAFLQLLRKIAVVQESFNNNTTIISTYLMNQPQIFISKDITKLMELQVVPEQLNIQVTSMLSFKQIHCNFSIQLILIDIRKIQQPVLFQQILNDQVFRFPEQKVRQESQIFYGPNLTLAILSSKNQYLSVYTLLHTFSQFSSPNVIYQIGCTFFQSEQILCVQFSNKIIQISNSNQKSQNLIRTTLTLIKCSCVKSESVINVIMQFKFTVYVQQYNYDLIPINFIEFPNQIEIISATILKKILFIVFINGQLTATTLSDQQLQFQISNFKINQIYTNQVDYPDNLFLDSFSELIILAYNGKQSYEIVNSITYPLQEYENIGIGILQDGIYFAYRNKTQSFLYFYPKENIFIQNSYQNYFQVYLDDYQIYQQTNILSAFSSNNFYLILEKDNFCYLSQYQATGTSYSALKSSYWIFDASQYSLLQLSIISQNEIKFEVEIIYINTDSYKLIQYPFLSYEFMFTTHYNENDITEQLHILYSAENGNFIQSILQNVTIIYESNLLVAINSDNEKVYQIEDYANIKINPSHLFFGNIQNYTVICDLCKSFNYIQPIDKINSYSLNIGYQKILNQKDFIYISDQQNNLYQFHPEIRQLSMLYRLQVQNDQKCEALFIEIQTQFPVQICSGESTYIYAFNTSSNQIITYEFSEISSYFSSDYKNCILQVFTNNERTKLDYFAFYFWIQNNEINLMQIYKSIAVCSFCQVTYVYLRLSQNFTSQPCQIFGFMTTSSSGSGDNIVFNLQNCIPTKICIIYGFTPNVTNSQGNIYFTKSVWKLKEKVLFIEPFYQPTMQFGTSKQISETIIEAKFIVSFLDAIDLYLILFNSTNGEIISFAKDQSFYLACSRHISLCTINEGADDMLLIQNSQQNGFYIPQIYSYEDQKYELDINTQKMNRIIGFENIQFVSKTSDMTASLSGNYYILGNHTHSQLYYVQNYLTLQIDLKGIQNAQIDIISHNPSKQIKLSFPVFNQNYIIKSNRVILYIVFCFLFLIIILLLILSRYCLKNRKEQTLRPLSYELIEK
ncbi:unnamed protein product [Paramecium sonneborni]|uniref:Transmembrane protein n=1 Tax=Paramecium sonneborni TaxID=65129 RepID=A0A8S1PAA7_9CILI|nr:unnamed protein product [Paramecium sonneborni]